jgi:7-carboxy-7-deazaguanine synthase
VKEKNSPATTVCDSLPIMEAFYTIQGEGFQTGNAAYFIRIAGCDVGCHWCDVKDSWDASGHPKRSVKKIVEEALTHPARLAVITGGEPLMYDLCPLTQALQENGFQTCIETSGAHPLSGNWHWICLSPKKFKPPVQAVHQAAHELKVIIFNQSDFKWAEEHADLVSSSCRLYLQPEWDKSEQMLPEIIDYVKRNPKWKISLQTHKFMDIP